MVGDIKNIVIIESLVNERLTGRELYDDVVERKIGLYKKPFTCKYHSVNTKHQFVELLKYYQENAPYLNGGLLLHLEMHGDVNLNGLILSNLTLISWKELVELFRPINILTSNNLFITMATCYGRYLYLGVDPLEKSPYSGYISASTAIYPLEIIDKFSILMDYLIENGNLVYAYLEMQKTESNFYYKDSETTFEESYRSIYDKLINDKSYKSNFLNGVKRQAVIDNQPEMDDSILEIIFNQSIKDVYFKQKNAFDFSNKKS